MSATWTPLGVMVCCMLGATLSSAGAAADELTTNSTTGTTTTSTTTTSTTTFTTTVSSTTTTTTTTTSTTTYTATTTASIEATTTASIEATTTSATTGTTAAAVVTTVTSTSTAAVTGSVTSTTAIEHEIGEIVSGRMLLEVSDPEAFVRDPAVNEAMAQGVAQLTGAPREHVSVMLSLARRLGSLRRASGAPTGGVLMEYAISILSAAAPVSSEDVQAALKETTAAEATATLSAAMSTSDVAGDFSLSVTSVPAPTVEVIATTATTTATETSTATSTTTGTAASSLAEGLSGDGFSTNAYVACTAAICGAGLGLGLWVCRAKCGKDGKCESSEDVPDLEAGANPTLIVARSRGGTDAKVRSAGSILDWDSDSEEDGMEVVQLDTIGSSAALIEEFSGLWYLEGNAEQLWAIRPDGRMFLNGEDSQKRLVQELDAQTGEPRLFCPQSRSEGIEIDMEKSEPRDRSGRSARVVWTLDGEVVALWYRSAKSAGTQGADVGPEAAEVCLDCPSDDDDKLGCGGSSLLEGFFGLWYAEGDAEQCWAIKQTGHACLNGRTTEWTFQEERDAQTSEARLFVAQRRDEGVEIDMQKSDARDCLVWTKDGEQVAIWHRHMRARKSSWKARAQPAAKPGRQSSPTFSPQTLLDDDRKAERGPEKKSLARGATQLLPYPSPSCGTLFSTGSGSE